MMSNRKHNFNAGPAALPLEVLEQVQRDLVDFDGNGLSLLEMSHRSAAFDAVIDASRQAIAELYGLPESHEVLFLQGGASLQFAMVPMNFGPGGGYLNTGTWSTKALKEARIIHGRDGADELWTDAKGGFRRVPGADATFATEDDTPYLHYTSNNTIYGTQYHHVPQTGRPLVADLSSDFLSRPMDLSRFAMVYAGAQKNAGPSGVTVVIANKDVSRNFDGAPDVPNILRYATHADKGSMYNTPNTFGIWLVGLVARWVADQGGLEGIAARNEEKAALLYGAIDKSHRFSGHAETDSRSRMNVTFRMEHPEHEQAFLLAAAERGMLGLKGHRSVGGLRASIYNAVPLESVQALVELIEQY